MVGSPCSPRDSQESSPTPQFKSIILWCSAFFTVQLSHPYMTTGKTIALNRAISSVQSLSRVRLFCDPMNRSTPGLPVHLQLPEFTQIHVHQVGDAIQPSHPLLSPFLPAPITHSVRIFSNESTLCMRWPKYWSFSFSIIPSKEIPGLISFR